MRREEWHPLLIQIVRSRSPELLGIAEATKKRMLKQGEGDLLVSVVGDEMSANGLDAQGKVTEHGCRLETLLGLLVDLTDEAVPLTDLEHLVLSRLTSSKYRERAESVMKTIESGAIPTVICDELIEELRSKRTAHPEQSEVFNELLRKLPKYSSAFKPTAHR